MNKISEFIEVVDLGPMPNGGSCPHCGAEGRYIYKWIDDEGFTRGAMAGCFKILTRGGWVNSFDQEYQKALAKQATGKKINGWDRSVINMVQKYRAEKQNQPHYKTWMIDKIRQIQLERKSYMARK